MVDWYFYVQAVISMLLIASPPDPVKVLFFDVARPPAGNWSLSSRIMGHPNPRRDEHMCRYGRPVGWRETFVESAQLDAFESCAVDGDLVCGRCIDVAERVLCSRNSVSVDAAPVVVPAEVMSQGVRLPANEDIGEGSCVEVEAIVLGRK
jgi:hypothetical protein